jgi:response regulator NasT
MTVPAPTADALPVLLVVGPPRPGWAEEARALGARLVEPATDGDLAAAVGAARSQAEELSALRREVAELRQALGDRKVVERAKGAVTRRCGVGEDEAYRRLRRLATDGGRRLIEVAREVLAAEDVFRALDGPAGG